MGPSRGGMSTAFHDLLHVFNIARDSLSNAFCSPGRREKQSTIDLWRPLKSTKTLPVTIYPSIYWFLGSWALVCSSASNSCRVLSKLKKTVELEYWCRTGVWSADVSQTQFLPMLRALKQYPKCFFFWLEWSKLKKTVERDCSPDWRRCNARTLTQRKN